MTDRKMGSKQGMWEEYNLHRGQLTATCMSIWLASCYSISSDRFCTYLRKRDYGTFSAGPLKNIGKRHFFRAEEIKVLFSGFVIEDIRALSIRPILDRSEGSEKYMAIARKPMRGSL